MVSGQELFKTRRPRTFFLPTTTYILHRRLYGAIAGIRGKRLHKESIQIRFGPVRNSVNGARGKVCKYILARRRSESCISTRLKDVCRKLPRAAQQYRASQVQRCADFVNEATTFLLVNSSSVVT